MPRTSPAAARNAAPIGRVFCDWFAELDGTLLEVGCGTGQHAAVLSARAPGVRWVPSDLGPDVMTIRAWRARAADPGRIAEPAALDVTVAADWRPHRALAAVVTINTLHIMRWRAVVDLFRHAAEACRAGARMLVYGPLHVGGRPTGPGNERFDRTLRSGGDGAGIRDLESVRSLAAECGWIELARYRMPADNQALVWSRARA